MSPTPHLHHFNIETNSRSNNVLLTVHALPLRGELAPCIPASQTHKNTHTHTHSPVWFRGEGGCYTEHRWSELLSFSALHSDRCGEPRVCPSLISKNSPLLCLSTYSWYARLWILTQALNKLIFTIRHKWTHTQRHVYAKTHKHGRRGDVHTKTNALRCASAVF